MTGINCPRLVIVLAGPTGAGKTHWIYRAGLDLLDWESSGRNQHNFLAYCAAIRHDRTARVAVERQLPRAAEREIYARAVDADAVYVLRPDLEVVLERIAARGRRAMWHEMDAARRWFDIYQSAERHGPPPDPETVRCLT